MSENLLEAKYDVTKKNKLKIFYDKNKFLIFSFVIIALVTFGSFSYYFENKEQKRILISEEYLTAKIYLEKNKKIEATNVLKKIINKNDSTYSTLSFFLLLNQNLVSDQDEIAKLFDTLIDNNNHQNEIKDLLIYKKMLFQSNYADESEMLESLKPILNEKSLWRPHGLILLGDYFASKGESIKAIEFYQEVFKIKNLHQNLYNHTKSQLSIIANE